jgi:hypothetical protein
VRRFLTITVTSLLLAGCAGNYDKLADAHVCEPSLPPSAAVGSQLFPSIGLAVPARSFLDGSKFDNDDTMTYGCIDPTGNKTNAPQVPNPHKIRLDHLSDAV